MTSAPKPTNTHSRTTSAPFGPNSNRSAKPTARLRNPHSTLMTGEDSPTPGGEANGGLEPVAADTLNEVRDAIRQKQSGDELQRVSGPGEARHQGLAVVRGKPSRGSRLDRP